MLWIRPKLSIKDISKVKYAESNLQSNRYLMKEGISFCCVQIKIARQSYLKETYFKENHFALAVVDI